MNEVKPDPNNPLEKLKTTYYVEFICIEKTTRTLKDRSEPKFFEIPGKFLIHKQAEQTYKNQYEERIKKGECTGKLSEYLFIKTLNNQEWKKLLTQLTIDRQRFYTIPKNKY